LQYDNENVTLHATNLHQKSHLDLSSLNSTHEELLTQPNPRKSCNFQTQPMDGPDPSSGLCSPLQGQLNGVFCGKSATSGHHAVSRVHTLLHPVVDAIVSRFRINTATAPVIRTVAFRDAAAGLSRSVGGGALSNDKSAPFWRLSLSLSLDEITR